MWTYQSSKSMHLNCCVVYFRKIEIVSTVHSGPVYLSAMPNHGLETMLCVQVPPLYKTVLGTEETYVKYSK